ncbi:hypothetical protein BUALT_Bualt07G0159900 [Buddleja alternifolia]|uniref:MYB transcription factor n=1 Tax=Buddleja alternifolia TaxID=168488 RepID=A0AAV6XCE3_9LAMI|nr:hypothetical protein BUALT_Bualt07G0159900 [Buddleja alternifolia]
MRNHKLKWTAAEIEALTAGVAKYGTGRWMNILTDSEFASKLANRSNVHLKDKWRNMHPNPEQGCSTDKSTTTTGKATASRAVAPKTQNNSSVSISGDKANDNRPRSPQDVKNILIHNDMILEAISSMKDPSGTDIGPIMRFIEQKYKVPQNFRRLLTSKLRRLVLQGKLDKVKNGYKIKDAALGTKTPTPKQKDLRPRSLQQSSLAGSDETIEDVAKTVAQEIAEAEYEAIMTGKAVEESEWVSQMAEETELMLILCKKYFEMCAQCEFILMD